MSAHGTFCFHPIGQGLFYSGILMKKEGNRNLQFSFVYDCGTVSPKEFMWQEIDRFKLLLKKSRTSNCKKLDLLVVSHLHDDHVNGLEYLLDGVEVDTVVMPYLSEGMKLLARLESSDDAAFLQSFYLDPVAWLEARGVRRILLLGAEESRYPRGNNQIRSEEYTNAFVVPSDNTEDNGETELVYLANATTLHSDSFDWKFCVENLCTPKWESYVETVEDYQRAHGVTLSQIFASQSHTKKLCKELNCSFSKSGHAINRTSVVLLHHPNKPNKKDSSILHINNTIPACYRCFPHKEKCFPIRYTILTGDIELNNSDSISILRKSEDGGKCPPTHRTLLQYPHHGADAGVFNSIDYGDFFYIVSYGITNKYGHPNSLIFQRFPLIEVVNERHSFDYEIFVE